MRIWPVLESLVGPAAVLAEWRHLVGEEELALLRPYLQPRAKRATYYPRVDGNPAHGYRVIEHGAHDIVGICDETQERISLTRQDLVIYEVNWARLLRDIALALGLEAVDDLSCGMPTSIRLAAYLRPLAGHSFPIYFVRPMGANAATQAIRTLATQGTAPFLVLAPTRSRLRPDGQQVLESRQGVWISLSEALQSKGPAQWLATESAQQTIQAFVGQHIPNTKKPKTSRPGFPTPMGVTWKDLSIQFKDGHTVAIHIGTKNGVYSFTDMGMADGRNAQPTKQWELLWAFAKCRGTLTWAKPDAHPNNQKRCELLARNLKAFFRIDGDPIVATQDRRGWRTVFAIAPD